jgi:hypothetical protein
VIVEEPPYDLVVLSSDAEMKALLERLIERGQTGRNCTRPFRWRCLRDPRRDTVWREPHRPLALFLEMDCSFLVVWDHQGSGRENRRPEDLESEAERCLTECGVRRSLSARLKARIRGRTDRERHFYLVAASVRLR